MKYNLIVHRWIINDQGINHKVYCLLFVFLFQFNSNNQQKTAQVQTTTVLSISNGMIQFVV